MSQAELHPFDVMLAKKWGKQAFAESRTVAQVIEERGHAEQRAANRRYFELRQAGAPTPEKSKRASYAKSLYQRDALREAGRRSVGLAAQGVLSILIAESWPHPDLGWTVKMSRQQLANRGDCTKASIDRALTKLVQAGLIEKKPGRARTVTRYVLARLEESEFCNSVQVSAGAYSQSAPAHTQSHHGRVLKVITGAYSPDTERGAT